MTDARTTPSPRRLRWLSTLWLAIPVLLAIPLIAMQFTDEVAWTPTDFLAAALLLGGALAAFEITVRLVADPRRRAVAGLALVEIVLLLWAQGAVGIV